MENAHPDTLVRPFHLRPVTQSQQKEMLLLALATHPQGSNEARARPTAHIDHPIALVAHTEEEFQLKNRLL